MTTMLKKALGAALDAIAHTDEVGDNEMRAALRAAFLAIRELDGGAVEAYWSAAPVPWERDEEDPAAARRAFAAMIDAILNERPEAQ